MTDDRCPSADFYRFVSVRQAAWHRRQLGWPREQWTSDPVLRQARFTNVYRALDRGTLFATWEILDAPPRVATPPHLLYSWSRRHHLLELALVYRWFNKIETYLDLRDIVKSYSTEASDDYVVTVTEMLRCIKERGRNLFTGAYMSTYCPNLGGCDTAHNAALVLRQIKLEVWERDLLGDLEDLCEAGDGDGCLRRITRIPGVGHFIGYQFLVDLGFPLLGRGYRPLIDGLDTVLGFWSDAGPGCIKGLAAMGVTDRENRLLAMQVLTRDQGTVRSQLGMDFNHVRAGMSQTDPLAVRIALSLSDIENCLCEYSKYVRICGGGHVKTVYRPEVQGNQGWNPPASTPPAWRGTWSLNA